MLCFLGMNKKGTQIKPHLVAKRNELIYALAKQEYNNTELGSIFNLSRSRIHAIVQKMPKGWVSPWSKRK
ncbi:prd paireD/DNA compleX-DNA compleX [Caudoviricetes sp.]|nr:prd paireD/DNA compleX-DNA compleX [Caudoviricetes sp.]